MGAHGTIEVNVGRDVTLGQRTREGEDDRFIARHISNFIDTIIILIITLSFSSLAIIRYVVAVLRAYVFTTHLVYTCMYIYIFYTYIFTNRKRSDDGPIARPENTEHILT